MINDIYAIQSSLLCIRVPRDKEGMTISKLYEGMECPFCHAKFFEDEDIVVCPVCGAPHHRECWQQAGHCLYEQYHGTPQQWKPPAEQPSAESYGQTSAQGDRVGHACPKCGRMSTSDTLFCPYCGFAFQGDNPPDDPPFNPFFQQSPPIDPLGGTDPTAVIDGVPVMEVSSFVATNTMRYIPKFQKLANFGGKKKHVSWNWSAFLFPNYWLFYRKCYSWGIAVTILMIAAQLLNLPFALTLSNLVAGQEQANVYLFDFVMHNINQFSTASILLSVGSIVLSLIIRIVIGILGDSIYQSHCLTKIKEIKASDVEDTRLEFMRKGGVNILGPVIAMMLENIFYIFCTSFL